MLNNDPQLFWSIALSILSVVLVVVSVVVSVLTLRQNSRMIEGSTRPYIGVSSLQLNNGSPLFMLVIKNYGASAGKIEEFKCDRALADYSFGNASLPLLKGMVGITIMPGQKTTCAVDYGKMRHDKIDKLEFTVKYSNGKKHYTDVSVVGVLMNANIVQVRNDNDNPLKNISYALQTITERMD